MIIEHEVLYNKQSCVSQMMPQAILHKELDMLFCLSVSKKPAPLLIHALQSTDLQKT